MNKIAWFGLLISLLCFAIYKFSDPDYDKTVNDELMIYKGGRWVNIEQGIDKPICVDGLDNLGVKYENRY